MDKQEKAKWYTLTELSKIDGAFDAGKKYKCVKTSSNGILINEIYTCNGEGVVFNKYGDFCASGGDDNLFEPVVEQKKYWNGDGKPKVGEIVNVDLGLEITQGLIVHIGQNLGVEVYVVQFKNWVSIKEIDDIKPIDTRTDKQKAIDDVYRSDMSVKENLCNAYDKWVGGKK